MVQNHTFRRLRDLAQMALLIVIVNLLTATAPNAKDTMKIIAFGDSLTAGFGVAPTDAFPAQLERALVANGHKVEIVNAGVSGDTAGAGLERFDWAVPSDAAAVILELGANDGLRGIDPKRTRDTLDMILAQLKARKLPVLIAGMRAPRNWGDAYAAEFDAMFPALAEKYGAIHYPFFLDGVVMDPALNQPDGIHPTAKGVAVIVERILPKVIELIDRSKAGP
jgi:acyl-CoA thioesterase I